jgi:hypothetical protein
MLGSDKQRKMLVKIHRAEPRLRPEDIHARMRNLFLQRGIIEVVRGRVRLTPAGISLLPATVRPATPRARRKAAAAKRPATARPLAPASPKKQARHAPAASPPSTGAGTGVEPPTPELSEAQSRWIERLTTQAGVLPAEAMDMRVFAALARRGFVRREEDQVHLTREGWAHSGRTPPEPSVAPVAASGSSATPHPLTPRQEQVLARLRSEGSVAANEIDGRTRLALLRRGLAELREDALLLPGTPDASPAPVPTPRSQEEKKAHPEAAPARTERSESPQHLTLAQQRLLNALADGESRAEAALDGRSLAALLRRGLVLREGDQVRLTARGRAMQVPAPEAPRKKQPASAGAVRADLSPGQLSTIRALCANGGEILLSLLDQRSVTSLLRRYMVEEADGVLRLTPKGKQIASTYGLSPDRPLSPAVREGGALPTVDLSQGQQDAILSLGQADAPLASQQLDRRTLRSLEHRGYAMIRDERAYLTEAGLHVYNLLVASGTAPAKRAQAAIRPPHELSDHQQDLLRRLASTERSLNAEDFDQRTLNSLVRLGLAATQQGFARATDAGRLFFERHIRRRRTARRPLDASRSARVAALEQCLEQVERGLPGDSVLQVGTSVAGLPVVIGALRTLLKRFSLGEDVSRLNGHA